MEETKYTCDCCGEVHLSPTYGYFSKAKWETIRFNLDSQGYNTKIYHVCPKCQPKLGISVKMGEEKKNEDIGNRLLYIIQEIVQMQGGGQ